MSKRILVVYKSVTGFTKQYAELIARESGGTALPLKKVTAQTMAGYDTVVFGGRLHAGMVSGLKKAKQMFAQSGAKQLLAFGVGAMPASVTDTVEAMWKQNLTEEELETVPHFYMQGGLRYDKMPLHEKLMMKAFSSMLKKKKDQTEYEREAGEAMSHSYDCFSEEQAKPIMETLKAE